MGDYDESERAVIPIYTIEYWDGIQAVSSSPTVELRWNKTGCTQAKRNNTQRQRVAVLPLPPLICCARR
jgi:hypothetical protein